MSEQNGLMQVNLSVFLLVFSVCLKISVQALTCSNNTFFIQYPFKLLQQAQKSHHIVLKCNRQGLVVLNLPLSGEFFVRNIDYFQQKIQIYDPGNCLPGRLRNLSLSSSPFEAVSYQNYTFFSCPNDSLSSSNLTAISCLSNSTASVVAASMVSMMDEIRNLTGCTVIYSLQAPVSQVFKSLYNGIDTDLQLAWIDPRSKGDHRGKPGVVTIISICAFTISTAFIAAMFCVGCGLSVIAVMQNVEEVNIQRLPRQQPRPSAPRQAAGPLDEVSFMSSAMPQPQHSAPMVAAALLGVTSSVAATLGESSPAPTSPSPRVVANPLHDVFLSLTPSPRARRGSAASIDGLPSTPSSPSVADHLLTIDDFSFMTRPAAYDDELPTEDVIIGGSEWPNGDSCTICLGEYKASERLRLIRRCNHCFHADCLEEWLKRKKTCPICRNNVIYFPVVLSYF